MNVDRLKRMLTRSTRVGPGREDLGVLVRMPVVQGLLVATAVTHVTLVHANRGMEAGELAAAVVELEAAVVSPDSDPALREAWLARAVERESDRLAAEYRSKGYNVPAQLARQIGLVAMEFDIEPTVAFGLVRAESSFRNQATSPVGAVGLAQLMPRTAAWIEPGVTRAQLRDPETNLRVGFKYLRYLMDKYEGDERLALIAYNRGPGTVDRALRRGQNPDNGYADFVYGVEDHGHRLFTRR